MGKSISRILIFVLFPSTIFAQSLTLSTSKKTADNNPSTFLLEQGELTIGSESLHFLSTNTTIDSYEVFGISPDKSVVGTLEREGREAEITLFNSLGDTLNSYAGKSLASDDPSLAVYPLNNSNLILRDNITNFTFYDTFGERLTNFSSSSESEEGEAVAELTMSADGQTIAVANPKVKRNGVLGSQLRVMLPDRSFQSVHFSTKRYLKEVKISADGNIIAAVTARDGTDDQVLIMDKYGNELNSISTDENLLGVSLSDDSEYITLFSSGRVMVYSILGGDRLGATSVRSPVFTADYFPEDNVLLILMGDVSQNSGNLNNVEFRAINLQQRSIATENLSGAIGFTKALSPNLVRISPNKYQLQGGSKRINISANF